MQWWDHVRATTVSSVPSSKLSTHPKLSVERSEQMADAIRSIRERARMTQEVLAVEAGITRNQIQRLERGVANPTVATLCAIADALGVAPTKLVPR